MLAIGPPSQELGQPQPVIEGHGGNLLAVPRVGFPEVSGLVPHGLDEARHSDIENTDFAAARPVTPG